jgi:hypothetical protein
MAVDQRFRVFKRGGNERAVILRMTKSEHAEIEAIADEADIGVSTVCKQLIRQALSRGVIVVEEQEAIAPEEVGGQEVEQTPPPVADDVEKHA